MRHSLEPHYGSNHIMEDMFKDKDLCLLLEI